MTGEGQARNAARSPGEAVQNDTGIAAATVGARLPGGVPREGTAAEAIVIATALLALLGVVSGSVTASLTTIVPVLAFTDQASSGKPVASVHVLDATQGRTTTGKPAAGPPPGGVAASSRVSDFLGCVIAGLGSFTSPAMTQRIPPTPIRCNQASGW